MIKEVGVFAQKGGASPNRKGSCHREQCEEWLSNLHDSKTGVIYDLG